MFTLKQMDPKAFTLMPIYLTAEVNSAILLHSM